MSLGGQFVWSFAYGLALLVHDATLRFALEVVVWAAMTVLIAAFLAFALEYTGRATVRGRRAALVAAAPVALVAVTATNPFHGLAWTGFAVDPVAGLATVTYDLRVWAILGTTAGVLLASLASLLLFETVLSYGPLYRREAVAVGLSTIPPSVALLVWLYGVGPVPALNLATVFFLPHIALDAYAFVGNEMFDFHPATRRAGDRVAITVADDGPGLPANELAVLAAGEETPLEHGTGLGLWLVTWGVERLGGELTVDAEDGTTVTVTLPAA